MRPGERKHCGVTRSIKIPGSAYRVVLAEQARSMVKHNVKPSILSVIDRIVREWGAMERRSMRSGEREHAARLHTVGLLDSAYQVVLAEQARLAKQWAKRPSVRVVVARAIDEWEERRADSEEV
jgi:hypothetical protein